MSPGLGPDVARREALFDSSDIAAFPVDQSPRGGSKCSSVFSPSSRRLAASPKRLFIRQPRVAYYLRGWLDICRVWLMSRRTAFSAQPLAVLAALVAEPAAWRHGYDLARETGLKSGSRYPILVRLADRPRAWPSTK